MVQSITATVRASDPHAPISVGLENVVAASVLAKTVGVALAWWLQQPSMRSVKDFVASRSSSRPLLDYATDWFDALGTEIAVICLEALGLRLASGCGTGRCGDSVIRAAAISDAVTLTPFAGVLRRLFSPLPSNLTSRHGMSTRVLPSLSTSSALSFGLVQALRTTVRTAVVITRRYLRGNTYLKPQAIAVQAVSQGVVTGAVTFAATRVTLEAMRRLSSPQPFLLWATVYGVSWAVASAVATWAVVAANLKLQRFVAATLYHPLPGVNNSRQRIFDLHELNMRFGSLSATELSEVSQFANEALRSTAIDQNTRLHAVRFLAGLTCYVRAVNAGSLQRHGRMAPVASLSYTSSQGTRSARNLSATNPPTSGRLSGSPTTTSSSAASMVSEADFERHTFTEKEVSDRRLASGAGFSCAKCGLDFKPKEKACLLPCGHLLHTGQCAQLATDWCPSCVRPTHSPSNEERMAVFIGMKAFVEELASEWESTRIIPKELDYAEWGYVAQFARKNKVVEGEVPLDVVPSDHVPGVAALLDTPIAGALWSLRLLPTDASATLFTLTRGW
jgi:hypothetical protein